MRLPGTDLDAGQPPRPARALAALVALVALALSPVLVADYIRVDDYAHILENANLSPTSLTGLTSFWSRSYFSLYIPVTYSLWWLTAAMVHALGEALRQGAWAFHGLNLILHLVNAVLVFLVVRTLLQHCREVAPKPTAHGEDALAATVALLFALHPVQVETVAWISECKGDLSATLGLLALLFHYRSSKKYLTVALLTAAALAKPSALVFPGILLLADRILLGRSLKASATLPVLAWLVALPIAVATKRLQPDLNIDFVPSFGERLRVAADALSFYLWKLGVPSSLALDYGRSPQYVLSHVGGWRVALSTAVSFAGFVVAAHAVLRPRPSRQWYAFVSCGWAVFAFALLPVLGLVPFGFQDFSTVADRYMYVSMFGASLMATGLLMRWRRRPIARAAVVVVVAMILAASSFRQATRWRSTETLFTHTLTVNPRSYLAHYSIAAEEMGTGRLDAGIAEVLKALAIKPGYLHAEVALGAALIQKGRYDDAIDHYVRALASHPNFAGKRAPLVSSIHNNLGMALHQVGRHAEGTEHFRKAVEVDPGSVNGHLNLGNAAFNDGRYLDAIVEYERALALDPGDRSVEQQLMRARRAARQEFLRPTSP
jgi:Tfp pilus assembly protein PilF